MGIRQKIRLIVVLLGVLPLCRFGNTEASPSEQEIGSTRFYADEVAAAANALIALTPPDQRHQLVLPFDSSARYLGRETDQTPSFCAVLEWCPIGWGLTQCSMTESQLVAMHKLLSLALSPGGYQTLLAIMNRQPIIGEIEGASDPTTVEKAAEKYPDARAPSIFDFVELAPVPPEVWYPTVGGADPSPSDPANVQAADVEWVWDAPGLATRRTQFCDYALAIYGTPGGAHWALRFEGHHITVNLTFLREQGTGQVSVHGTPLFFGAFPMIVPDGPVPATDLSQAWAWTKGQTLMFSTAHHLRKFWLALPASVRSEAHIASNFFPQAAPLLLSTPPPFMISSLATTPEPTMIKQFPNVQLPGRDLSDEAVWHLKQAFDAYVSALNPTMATQYLKQIEQIFKSKQETITLSWAGGALEDFGSEFYSYVAIGRLLLEFLQSEQFSVEHDPVLRANHVHGMLRDLAFDWTDPMAEHHRRYHIHHHHEPTP